MTREIKFRAWCEGEHKILPKGGKTICGGEMEYEVPLSINGHYLLLDGYNADRVVGYIPTIPLMQFTGLKDKNGKEIYEGDIVQGVVKFPQLLIWQTNENSNVQMAGEVFYDHHSFNLKCIQSMCDEKREGMVNYFDFIGSEGEIFDEMEVIGNIYENKELLQ